LKQQELSYEEIAETMDQSVAAVKTHIFRGRQKLKEVLRKIM
jgi:DNA-directed RNA polymerase specialized sigma24 family protein